MSPSNDANYTGGISGPQLLSALWLVLAVPPALLLLLVADSASGRVFAGLTLLLGILPLQVTRTCSLRTKVRLFTTAITVVSFIALGIVVLCLQPSGQTAAESRVFSTFAADSDDYPYGSDNLLPEGDQLLFGFTLMPWFDPLFTTSQASQLKSLTAELYRELEADPDFRALGSVMSGGYRELLSHGSPPAHSFVYIPPGVDRSQPRPVLVFFHGSGGNFKAYLWILSAVADELGWILVAPSNGLGRWRESDSHAALELALAGANERAAVSADHVHLLGLSNGGLALSRIATRALPSPQSIVFISPVFDLQRLKSPVAPQYEANSPILVISGSRDDRVTPAYVTANVRFLQSTGASVELQWIDGANHFLLFSHREQVAQMLTAWYSRPGNEDFAGAARRKLTP